ncbi:MAG: molybdopterin cofactor-binding domain-containing protein [Woeseia sp.]
MTSIAKLSRRQFLQVAGVAGGGLVLALNFGCQHPEEVAGANFSPNVYVNIRNDGIVEIYCHRSEMGQGVRTSLVQVIADELEADWSKIELLQAPGDPKYGDQNTDGSTSIRQHFDLLRTAGASAREMLIAAAAAMWSVPARELIGSSHAVHHAASGRSAEYGKLVAAAADIALPDDVKFKNPSDYRYIGKPVDLIDGVAMTTGTAMFGIDTVVAGMLYASIARCPVVGGTVKSLDDSAARAVSGVEAVVRMPDGTSPPLHHPLGGVAVVAGNTWSADRGRAALEIEWDLGLNGEYDSPTYRRQLVDTSHASGTTVLSRGDVDAAFAEATTMIEADYYAPHLVHATMEPPAAVARMTDEGGVEIWAATQDPQGVQEHVAGLLGIDKSQVEVHVTLLGGGFGRKSKADFSAEAAWLARETDKPVKVTWTREDDIRHGYYHAVSAQYLKAALNERGETTAWLHRSVFPSIDSMFSAEVSGPANWELELGMIDNPFAIPNMRLESGEAKAHVRIGWLRSVNNVYHAFAVCGFADELAHAAGVDPKEYLLRLAGPPRRVNPADDGAEYSNYGQELDEYPIDTGRYAAVVNEVAEMAGWGRELPDGEGLGIAVHRSFLTTVGTVAHVRVDEAGKLHVEELWFAVDAGRVVNPDRVVAQMEGAGIFGMSLALHGEITAQGGAIVQANYDSYPIVRISEAPKAINVQIMNTDAPPGGVGEPGVPPVAPAIFNAYFAATGKRLREMPLREAELA